MTEQNLYEHVRNENLKLISLMGDLSKEILALKDRIITLELNTHEEGACKCGN